MLRQKIPRRGLLHELDVILEDIRNDEVDDGECENNDYETNDTVKNGILGFFDFAGITRRSHIADTADNDDDYGDDTKNGNNCIDNASDAVDEVAFTVTNCVWNRCSESCE